MIGREDFIFCANISLEIVCSWLTYSDVNVLSYSGLVGNFSNNNIVILYIWTGWSNWFSQAQMEGIPSHQSICLKV